VHLQQLLPRVPNKTEIVGLTPLRSSRAFPVSRSVSNRRNVTRAASAQEDSQTKPDDDDEILFEAQLKARRQRNRRVQKKSGSAVAAAEKPLQAEPLAGSETETLVLKSLAAGFCIILLQGVALAGSGFLPEAADNFIVDYIYPSFSWQMGIFFSCTTVYGLWKTSSTK